MLKDTSVLYFDLEDFIVEVIREDLLPFCLRSNIRKSIVIKDILHNIQAVKNYLNIADISNAVDYVFKTG